MAAEFVPHHVTDQACGDREYGNYDQACLSVSGDGSSSEQDGNRRNRNADLLRQDGEKQHHLDMTEQKFQHLFHVVLRLRSGTTYTLSILRITAVSARTSSGPSCR